MSANIAVAVAAAVAAAAAAATVAVVFVFSVSQDSILFFFCCWLFVCIRSKLPKMICFVWPQTWLLLLRCHCAATAQ